MAFDPEYLEYLEDLSGHRVGSALPTITTAGHSHSLYSGTGLALANAATNMGSLAGLRGQTTDYRGYLPQQMNEAVRGNEFQKQEIKMADPKRRLVKVIIIDPDDKVPLDKCVLYSGDEKLTDLTDQELFFEIEIKTLLEDHNFERTKLIDKSVKERMEHLEPVKVRDLRMVVVTVASF